MVDREAPRQVVAGCDPPGADTDVEPDYEYFVEESLPCRAITRQIPERNVTMSQDRNWLTISDSAAWLIGGMASVMIATTMAYAGWLGASVSELKTDLAKVNAKMDYLSQTNDARVTLVQTMLEDKIASLKIEIDKLRHNDEIIGEKLLSSGKSKRK